eukprot:scaffold1471_cov73-Phaeocystis_antarctica.AAC.2
MRRTMLLSRWTVGDIDIGQSRFPRSQVAQHTAPAKTHVLVTYHKDILAKVSDNPVIGVESHRPRGDPFVAVVDRNVHALFYNPSAASSSTESSVVPSADAVHQQNEAHLSMFGEGRVELVRQSLSACVAKSFSHLCGKSTSHRPRGRPPGKCAIPSLDGPRTLAPPRIPLTDALVERRYCMAEVPV